jgi:alkanesulfonate monooxygenase SsuD/methylene tetrahydromethanopterin reductase-like flavin-dependent oxidoreductase (luciferase family)
VRAACERIGRDPDSIVYSIAGATATGPTDALVAARAEAANSTPDRLRAGGFAGSAAEVADKVGALRELGFSRVYFQLLDIPDLDQADFIAREVLPQLA